MNSGNDIYRGAGMPPLRAGECAELASPRSHATVLRSGSSHPLVGILDRHRSKYVRDMRWMGPDHLTDFDRYDSPDRWTHSYVETIEEPDGEAAVVSSFRLTKVSDLGECMSLEMVSPEAVQAIPDEERTRLAEAADSGVLYDLTRLLPASSKAVSTKEYLASFVRLIGFGMHHTVIEPEQDPIWVFAATAKTHAVLRHLGIVNHVLAEDRPETPDGSRTILCYVRPLEALDHVLEKKEKFARTLENVVQGIESARLTPVN